MADRRLLHKSKLELFKKWLIADGWNIEETKGDYEVLRARKATKKRPLIVYSKLEAKEHYSVMNKDCGVVGAFIRDCRRG